MERREQHPTEKLFHDTSLPLVRLSVPRFVLSLLITSLPWLRGSELPNWHCYLLSRASNRRCESRASVAEGRHKGNSNDKCCEGMCTCVYISACGCVCKIRPGKGEFQSFTGYQHWLLCCGAFKLAGLFIAFHNAPRTASVVCAEEGSQIKIRCQTELMYLQRRMASLQNLH